MYPYWKRVILQRVRETPDALYDHSHLLGGFTRRRRPVSKVAVWCWVVIVLGVLCALHEAGWLW